MYLRAVPLPSVDSSKHSFNYAPSINKTNGNLLCGNSVNAKTGGGGRGGGVGITAYERLENTYFCVVSPPSLRVFVLMQ